VIENKHKQKKVLLFLNQILVISYLVYEYLYGIEIKQAGVMPLFVITMIVVEAIYISDINLKNSSLLNVFINLLILISWYLLLSLDRSAVFLSLLSVIMVLTIYFSLNFILIFFFQDMTYTYQKGTGLILKINCVFNLISKLFDDGIFNFLYLFQLIMGVLICLFLFIVHKKRILFVLKSEWKKVRYSLTLIIVAFIFYAIVFQGEIEYIDNLGSYLTFLLILFCMHNIFFKQSPKEAMILPKIKRDKMILGTSIIIIFTVVVMVLKLSVMAVFIIIHSALAIIILWRYLIYRNNINDLEKFNFYTISLKQIKREEEIKKEFSNYLHDDILQDLLSIKNMMKKSENEEVKKMIMQTLDNLNHSIRAQAQEYSPSMLKTLTIKDNFENLIVSIQNKYPTKKVDISFECDNQFFLVNPYDIILYRILKELVTNALKHSKSSKIEVKLINEKEIIKLFVKDEGVGISDFNKSDAKMHKGLLSIQDQLALIDGKMSVVSSEEKGTNISVCFPMKGEASYAHFINR